jgi:hypothetical protein
MLKVLYIAGWGRSGSTLLNNILGQLDNFVAVGELRYVWDRGVQNNQRCGCGEGFRQCAFWSRVFREAFGGFEGVSSVEMVALREQFDHARKILQVGNINSAGLERYRNSLVKLYKGVATVSAATVVVDSSKTPAHGRILQDSSDLELHVVHLVRDPRAVAYSWQRKKPTAEGSFMTQFSSTRSALLWNGMNTATEMLRRRHPERYLRIRYEDLVTAPRETLESVTKLVGADTTQIPASPDGRLRLDPVHVFSGNPSGFDFGTINLRADNEWREKLALKDWLIVTTLTAPLLRRYGYRFALLNQRTRPSDVASTQEPHPQHRT